MYVPYFTEILYSVIYKCIKNIFSLKSAENKNIQPGHEKYTPCLLLKTKNKKQESKSANQTWSL